ncbi:hypothetical protein D9758_018666 [Tetrapyrgos nigripes]|uniref:DNA 3'-5' helicase n=1 Tax=Tetrapyrgos nigripes TaxID=182062 RepID=A0A8H5BVP3_9AGAR|nr:hypothetical protein D9758_018666 [Tetrapyrgos nigripes]
MCVTKRTQCPKPLQLKFACAVHKKQDVFMNVQTGSGKTLAMILLLLLADGSFIVIIISQLKRLQASQANALREKYGLCAVIVNEDSPKDDAYWKTHAYDFRLKRPGSADVFISTPEQFFVAKEGYPMIFSRFVRKSVFNQQIGLIGIDKAHFVHLYGLEHYGIRPFRPAYGNLAGIKNIFGPNVPWAAMTASATHQSSVGHDSTPAKSGKLWDSIKTTPDTTPSTLSKLKSRSGKKQHLLEKKLEAWRLEMHQVQPWPPRPVYYILPDSHIKLLAAFLPHSIWSTHDLIGLTGQSVEWGRHWGTSLCKLVMEFDRMEEMVRSPEFIEESVAMKISGRIYLPKTKRHKNTDNCALKAMGTDRYETDKRRRSIFFEITNE